MTRPEAGSQVLDGKRVLVTRARHQGGELVRLLEAAGAEVRWYPLLAIEEPEDPDPLAAALARYATGAYDFLVAASRNAVERCAARTEGPLAARAPGTRAAAVGPGTAAVLSAAGFADVIVGARHDAEGLLAALVPRLGRGARVLLPRAANAHPRLAEGLRGAGAAVDDPIAYRPVDLDPEVDLAATAPDAIPVTSAASWARLRRAAGADSLRDLVAAGCRLVAMGARSSAAIEADDLPVRVVAAEASAPALVEAIAAALETQDAG